MTRIGATLAGMTALLVVAGLACPGHASAASAVCADLEARLAAQDAAGSGPASRFDRAIDTQQAELARAREEARRARCGFAVAGNAIARCASINAQIGDMEDNLAALQRRRGGLVGGSAARERSRLLGMMETNGCRRQEEASRRLPRAIDARTGREIEPRRAPAAPLELRGSPTGDPNHIVLRNSAVAVDPNGAYRTLCVRTCDGYYFPISYAVSPAQFPADEQACAARCPSTAVELYVHRVPGGESEDMVSAATGEPYTQLPNAFRYRKAGGRPRGACTCQAAPGRKSFSVIASRPAAEGIWTGGDDGGSIVTLPLPDEAAPDRAAPAEQAALPPPSPAVPPGVPEPAPTEPATATMPPLPETTSSAAEAPARPATDRDIRVVGPRFFPDPSKAIDLRAPAPTQGR